MVTVLPKSAVFAFSTPGFGVSPTHLPAAIECNLLQRQILDKGTQLVTWVYINETFIQMLVVIPQAKCYKLFFLISS